jgi:aspartyl-tRNA(Asn)/glutamyl-tRNA(Gln) amidotransferase subunit A
MGACCTAPSYQDVIDGKSKSTYNDDLQILANFSGSPSITIPCGFINKMPIGININCLPFADQQLLNIALTLEEIIDKEFAC